MLNFTSTDSAVACPSWHVFTTTPIVEFAAAGGRGTGLSYGKARLGAGNAAAINAGMTAPVALESPPG